MNGPKFELTKSRLMKAKRDMETAHRLAQGPDPYFDTGIYHYQQAGEKALKGFLVFNNKRFEKTHDLNVLLQLAMTINKEFSSLLDAGDILTPYAKTFRYPGDDIEPSKEEFEEAALSANNILAFVITSLPKELNY